MGETGHCQVQTTITCPKSQLAFVHNGLSINLYTANKFE
jgi:hypothetical protein